MSFQELPQVQAEDQQTLQGWLAPGGSSSATPETVLNLHLLLSKMGPQDDPEALLGLFEHAATASIASGGPPGLRKTEDRSPAEQHRQRFRSLTLSEIFRPFAFAQQLRDACGKWVLAGESRSVEDVIELIVLEQLIVRLPRKTAEWVQCHRPTSVDDAVQLAEAHMAA